MHIGVFDVLNKVLFQKLTGDVSKKLIFCRFLRFFFAFAQNPYFLVLAFPFVGFEFLCFFFFPCCCCFTNQVAMFWFLFFVVLGFLGLLVCYVLCYFWFVFGFFCFLFFGGFKGQVRWPKGPPQLTLNPLCLFCFVFVLFLFVLF